MIVEFFTIVLVEFAALLPIANPFSTAVVFIAITRNFSDAKKQQQAFKACAYMAGILIVFLVAGSLIMNFFGISLPGVRIAGGIIVAGIGFGMLKPDPSVKLDKKSQQEIEHMDDVAFTPLAMPMLSGPGSIAVTIGLAAQHESGFQYLGTAAGIFLVALVSWLVLRSSDRVVGFLGATGVNALTRIMGFLLVCVGVQLVAFGLYGYVANEDVIRSLVEMVQKYWV